MNIIMNDMNIKKQLHNQTPLRILSFISLRFEKLFSAGEISKQTKSSKGATNQALRLFLALDILKREKKGNLFLYKVNFESFVLRQFKIFENAVKLQPIIKEIRPYCWEITLFGSCADGSNAENSDIDIFIKSEHKSKIRKIINKYDEDFKIRPVIQDSLELVSAQKTDSVFFEQVRKGIVIWKGKPSHEEI